MMYKVASFLTELSKREKALSIIFKEMRRQFKKHVLHKKYKLSSNYEHLIFYELTDKHFSRTMQEI